MIPRLPLLAAFLANLVVAQDFPIYRIQRRDTCLCPVINGVQGQPIAAGKTGAVAAVVGGSNAVAAAVAGSSPGARIPSAVTQAIINVNPGSSVQGVQNISPGVVGYVYVYPSVSVQISVSVGVTISITTTSMATSTFTTTVTTAGGAGVAPIATSSVPFSNTTMSRNSASSSSTESSAPAVLRSFSVVSRSGAQARKRAGPYELAVTVTINENASCGSGGFQIVSASGVFSQAGSSQAVTLDTTGASGITPVPDNCFYPNNAPNYFDAAGAVFKAADGSFVNQRTSSSGPELQFGTPGNYMSVPSTVTVVSAGSASTVSASNASATASNGATVTSPTAMTSGVSTASSTSATSTTRGPPAIPTSPVNTTYNLRYTVYGSNQPDGYQGDLQVVINPSQICYAQNFEPYAVGYNVTSASGSILFVSRGGYGSTYVTAVLPKMTSPYSNDNCFFPNAPNEFFDRQGFGFVNNRNTQFDAFYYAPGNFSLASFTPGYDKSPVIYNGTIALTSSK